MSARAAAQEPIILREGTMITSAPEALRVARLVLAPPPRPNFEFVAAPLSL